MMNTIVLPKYYKHGKLGCPKYVSGKYEKSLQAEEYFGLDNKNQLYIKSIF